MNCVFCSKFEGLAEDIQIIDFEPLNPVVPGHRLVVPRKHVSDFAEDPDTSAEAMKYAAVIAQQYPSFNIITSKGKEATQSIFHMHIHIVPRVEGDNLKLPWTDQLEG